ncbi:MAG: hypothetical protein J0L94_16225 [Rhodothermia bacterium]|nr:hypothetical protein [Rhodothermia bacterium]
MKPPQSKQTLATIGFCVFAVVMFVVMRLLDAPLLAKGHGIVAFEFAGTPEQAFNLLRDWGSAGQRAAYTSLWWDFLFMLAYGGALVLLVRQIARRHRRIKPSRIWAVKSIVVAAVVLDITENIALLQVLQGNLEGWVLAAWWSALVKFILIGIVLALLMLGFVVSRKTLRT